MQTIAVEKPIHFLFNDFWNVSGLFWKLSIPVNSWYMFQAVL